MIDYKSADLFYKENVDKQWRIECEDVYIENDRLFSQSIEITESLFSDRDLKFGSCESSQIKFKIANNFISLMGKQIRVSIVLNHNEEEIFFVGEYKVISDKPTADRVFRDITAYDAMYDIINSSAINWYNTILPERNSKVTMRQFRTSFIEYFGLEQKEITLANDDMTVEKTIQVGEGTEIDNEEGKISILKESSLSGRDVITAICEINGCFGHIGREGKFHYIYLEQDTMGLYPSNNLFPDHAPDYLPQSDTGHLYPQSPKNKKIGNSLRISADYEDYICRKINKLQIRQKENDIGVQWPKEKAEKENAYVIEDNFLVYGKSAEELSTIAKNVFEKIRDVVYRPFSAVCVGNPCIEVGDAVSIPTKYELIESYVFKRNLKGIQALRDSYSAEGQERRSEKVNSVSKSIIQLKGKTNTLERNVEKTVSKIEDVERGLSSKIEQTVSGISMSVKNGEDGKTAEVTLHITEQGGAKYDVTADEIDFTGLVSFTNLETEGQTNINGDNITTGTINSINIHNGNITDGKYPFSVDPNGNMFANNATIWGNLYGLDNLKLYNNIKGTHRTVIRLINGDYPDSAQFEFLKPVSGKFLTVNEQEGVFFTDQIKFRNNIILHNNLEMQVEENSSSRIETYGPDNKKHDIITIKRDSVPMTIGLGMDSSVNTRTLIRGKTIQSQNGITSISDERLKNSFKPLDEFDNVYMGIEPCAFKYNSGTSGRYHFGFVAQNVKESLEINGRTTQDFGGFVQMSDIPEREDYCGVEDPMGVIYTEFVAWNTHMIQKLYAEKEEMKKEIDLLKKSVSFLMERIGARV